MASKNKLSSTLFPIVASQPSLCDPPPTELLYWELICVANSLANGSQAVVEKINLKPGAEVSTVYLDSNIPI